MIRTTLTRYLPSLQTVEQAAVAGWGKTAAARAAGGRRSDGMALAVGAVVADSTPLADAVSGYESGNPAVAFGDAA